MKTEAQKLADKAINEVKGGYAYLNDITLEYLAYGKLAEALVFVNDAATRSLLDLGVGQNCIQPELNKRRGEALVLYTEAIALVRKHFNKEAQ